MRGHAAYDASLAWTGAAAARHRSRDGLFGVDRNGRSVDAHRQSRVVLPHAARHVPGDRLGRCRRRVPGADEGVGAAAPWLFIVGAVLLVLVLVPGIGKSVNGSRRWLSLFVVNVQPSEFMKLAVVLYAASYAVRRASFLHAEQPLKQTLVRGFLPLFAVMVGIGGLLLLEPDFGAFVVIVAIAFGILFLGGLDWRLFLGLALLLPFALGGDPRCCALSPAAPHRVSRSVVRSARQGLPALALADRLRARRMVRRGPGRLASRSSSFSPKRTPISCWR